MNTIRATALLAASLVAATAWAQDAGKPLNLKLPPQNALPPSDLPAASATAAKPASSAPGVYYGDTSGRMGNVTPPAEAAACDDSTYTQPQVHGSVGMGVMGGNHVSGNYQTGTVSVTRRLGDCEEPKGGVSFSIGVGQGHFHGH
ncbi:hypothetical protein QMK61_13890 [Fulvimonas sp. R45]|uniref:hypothetical protein n=1 Tax=Fulvimonas sp. R45 TaxID=3045937 RepID=UPI00265DF07A|nr:hypothetical protein [Fulvimonas sp. R45]MDO1529926.1 hypothetical protein [Fulvimonas sp. R45]